jgi:hypothetical protein
MRAINILPKDGYYGPLPVPGAFLIGASALFDPFESKLSLGLESCNPADVVQRTSFSPQANTPRVASTSYRRG